MNGRGAVWLVFHEREVLVLESGAMARLPAGDDAPVRLAGPPLVTGIMGDCECRAARAASIDELPQGAAFQALRPLHARVDAETFRMVGRALQLVEWEETHRFCGRCGAATEASTREHVRICPRCGLHHFPRVAPAVIVAVTRGDRILLGRHSRLPDGMFSVLAGFVEPGETLEETVHRELREEVGIEVKNVRYFGSQPWPFPHSLMVAFTAEWASGELHPDPAELEEADWFSADALPRIPPRISIARALIDAWRMGAVDGANA